MSVRSQKCSMAEAFGAAELIRWNKTMEKGSIVKTTKQPAYFGF